MKLIPSLVGCLFGILINLLPESSAQAFPHVVQQSETLASLAKRYYGRVQNERLITAANSLLLRSPRGLIPGMIIEIPSLTYHRVNEGENWKSLGLSLLGDEERYIVLAQLNDHKPWIQPEIGQLIVVPFNLTWIASEQDSLTTLAYRFLGSTKHAYRLVQYNGLKEEALKRGQVLLLPISNLTLTEEGQIAAQVAYAKMTALGQGTLFEHQKAATAQLSQLTQDVRGGRYISAVALGNQLLSQAKLSEPSRAAVYLLLLETYVALDARGSARTACASYRALRAQTPLDPLVISPKILKLCPNGGGGQPGAGAQSEPGSPAYD